jgi:hypothetical protein
MSFFESSSLSSSCGFPDCASYFESYPGAGGIGQGIYDNNAKSLTMYVSRLTSGAIQYSFSFRIQNPPYGQYAPKITMQTWGHNYFIMNIMPLSSRNEEPLLIGRFVIKSIRQRTVSACLF